MSKIENKQILYPLSGSFTGSLYGSASYAQSSSYLNGLSVTQSAAIFPIYSGSTAPTPYYGGLYFTSYSVYVAVEG